MQGFLTHLQLSEAKRIAKTKDPSVFDKKKLIQYGWLQFKGDRLPVDRIDEDDPRFKEMFEKFRDYFRDESIQETTNTERSTKKRLGD